MPVLAAHDLEKSFGARKILDGATCVIRTGERVGLVGINGSGKSTLARVLAGVEPTDGGTLTRRRGAEVAYLDQDPKFAPELLPREVVVAGLTAWTEAKTRYDEASRAITAGEGDAAALLAAQTEAAHDVERHGGWDVMHSVDAILGHVGVSRLDAPMGALSGGDRRRVALARILVARPDLAILDEPSNHLDVDTIEWLERWLVEEYTGALLLITHDRYLLDRVATRTLEIDRGKLYDYDGGYEAYLEAKAERLEHEARTEANRQNFLRTELEWLRRQPKARSTKQKARIQRAEAAKSIAAPKADKTLELTVEAVRAGRTLVELKHVELAIGGRTLVKDLDLIVGPGERVGIVGKNGTGKTTLIRAVLGELAPARGEIVIGRTAKIAYFDQLRAGLDDALSIFDNVAKTSSRIVLGSSELDTRSYLERFLFDTYKQRQPVGSLSGGERARVALAKVLANGANVVILDEPTNDLDVATLGALEGMLLELGGAALVVTHDRWFLNRIATSVLAFEGDAKVVRYAGNYDAYREQKAHADAEREAELEAKKALEAKAEPKREAKPKAAGKGLTYAERIELESLLDKVDAAEQAVAALEAKLADPSLYSARGAEVPKLRAELEAAKADAAKLTARWEELETKKSS